MGGDFDFEVLSLFVKTVKHFHCVESDQSFLLPLKVSKTEYLLHESLITKQVNVLSLQINIPVVTLDTNCLQRGLLFFTTMTSWFSERKKWFGNAKNKFSNSEFVFMTKTFEHLAKRSGVIKAPSGRRYSSVKTILRHGEFIDKDAFLQWFPLPGVLGDRLFAVFDDDHDGVISMEEFFKGMVVCLKGSHSEKYEFAFRVYCLQGREEGISSLELKTMLVSVYLAKDDLFHRTGYGYNQSQLGTRTRKSELSSMIMLSKDFLESLDDDSQSISQSSIGHYDEDEVAIKLHESVVDKVTQIVEEAFSGLGEGERLTLARFQQWAGKHCPLVAESLFYNKFILDIYNRISDDPSGKSKRRASSVSHPQTLIEKEGFLSQMPEGSLNEPYYCTIDERAGTYKNQSGLPHLLKREKPLNIDDPGLANHILSSCRRCFYVLRDGFLYYYNSADSAKGSDTIAPDGALFLRGGCARVGQDINQLLSKGMFRLDLIFPNCVHAVFCNGERERIEWQNAINTASRDRDISNDFEMNESVLGTGCFSSVILCVHKATKKTICCEGN